MREEKSKDRLISFLLMIICAAVIYSCGTFYFSLQGLIFSLLLIFISLVVLWLINPFFDISKNILIGFIIYIFGAIIILINSHFTTNSVFMLAIAFPICIWLTYLLLIDNLITKFVNIFVNIMAIVAIISMIFWLFGSILQKLHPTSVVYSGWSSEYVNSFYGIYFQPQGADINLLGLLHISARNSAIFFEAPLATFLFGFSLLVNEFIETKKIYRLIFLLAIITTFDTTSIIVLLLYILYYVRNIKYMNRVFLILIETILSAVVIILISIVLQNKAIDGGSFQDRSYHMIKELQAFTASPIYGKGFDVFTKGSSNSICAVAADGGILLWLMYYFPLLKIIGKISRDKRILLIIFIIMFSITVIQYTYLMYIIVSFAWMILLDPSKNNLLVKEGRKKYE